MTETGLGGGVDCAARRGYHLREADVYYEIIDPRTGSPLTEGERGEIVVTTLTRSGMPLLRYRTGDYSRWLPGGCPCGTVLRTMEHVRGRAGQAIELGGGPAVTLADLDDILFALDGLIDYRAAVGGGEDARRLDIRFRAAPGSPACHSGAIRDALLDSAALGRFIKDGSLVLASVEPRGRPWASDGAAKRTLQVEI
jgi:phenylacetate-coenzyme A ligase PaaK-like adenylate-forming protein